MGIQKTLPPPLVCPGLRATAEQGQARCSRTADAVSLAATLSPEEDQTPQTHIHTQGVSQPSSVSITGRFRGILPEWHKPGVAEPLSSCAQATAGIFVCIVLRGVRQTPLSLSHCHGGLPVTRGNSLVRHVCVAPPPLVTDKVSLPGYWCRERALELGLRKDG